MYIKNKLISIIYKILFFVIGFIGVYRQLKISGNHWYISLNYYTILSNILCILYFISSAIYLIKNYKTEEYTFLSKWKGALVICITITMLVFHILLSETAFKMGKLDSIANLILHTIIPLAMIFDYILFDKKGTYKKSYPFKWVIIPGVYLVYILLRAEISSNLILDSRYPYFFLDIDMHGVPMVFLYVLAIGIGCIILGYILYFIDKKLGKKVNSHK